MIVSPLQAATRRVLNDRRIFAMEPQLIAPADFRRFVVAFSAGENSTVADVLSQAKGKVDKQIKEVRDRDRLSCLQHARRVLDGLGVHIAERSATAGRIVDSLDSFGLLRCLLPKMEDYGPVIERYDRSTVETIFYDRIRREQGRRGQALAALLDVVTELYDRRVEPLEIAFFVRKIDSLSLLIEVLV